MSPYFPVGQHGIICLEDLIHEIYSTGKNFKEANSFLWPFYLSVPRHSAQDKAGLLKEMGEPGPRAEDINRVIRRFNWISVKNLDKLYCLMESYWRSCLYFSQFWCDTMGQIEIGHSYKSFPSKGSIRPDFVFSIMVEKVELFRLTGQSFL